MIPSLLWAERIPSPGVGACQLCLNHQRLTARTAATDTLQGLLTRATGAWDRPSGAAWVGDSGHFIVNEGLSFQNLEHRHAVVGSGGDSEV